ncbi:beta-N-acetylhexosaminidase [uncultured Kriegella sp.]|uniref:beta-N-acetylhexosaminidase n=1 Tax=uncultured Kriegella sp. TaxID=1798910 RepID=UPI0030D7E1FB|tara:strand:+ start:29261 stop:30898 length:1638 start_codon:yes stop_codon:yes gene_type:complete
MFKQLKNSILSLFLTMLPFAILGQSSDVQVIPRPNQVIKKSGHYIFSGEDFTVHGKSGLQHITKYTTTVLEEDFGWKVKTVDKKTATVDLLFELSAKEMDSEESYTLRVDKKGIRIAATSEQGLFYGLQTLRQSFKEQDGKWTLDHMEIKDTPRFGWRAYMLDEGRYFKGKEQVKKILDEMARLKMNVFHWHLVDDQGWRIEIKKYPLLTEIGSKRPTTQVGPRKWQSPIQSGVPHEGFYTQDEIREIVSYARERHITVVPEIEIPGHSSAAIAAYPWLGSSGKQIEVPIKFGVSKDIFNVANPKVFSFLTNVLDEVMALFPSKVIHIGGDEAKYDHWESSKDIKSYMKENNLKSFADVQIDFTNKISRYIESKGRKMMGWNEILGHNVHDYQSAKDEGAEEKLSKSSVVHFWKGDIKLMAQAASEGYDIVNSLHSETYLDYSYKDISLRRAYDFDPVPEDLDEKYHKRIIGTGCQMWGEWIPSSGYMDFMTFPRIAAYAEVGWTRPNRKDFESFLKSLSRMAEIWQAEGIFMAPIKEAMPVDGQ